MILNKQGRTNKIVNFRKIFFLSFFSLCTFDLRKRWQDLRKMVVSVFWIWGNSKIIWGNLLKIFQKWNRNFEKVENFRTLDNFGDTEFEKVENFCSLELIIIQEFWYYRIWESWKLLYSNNFDDLEILRKLKIFEL